MTSLSSDRFHGDKLLYDREWKNRFSLYSGVFSGWAECMLGMFLSFSYFFLIMCILDQVIIRFVRYGIRYNQFYFAYVGVIQQLSAYEIFFRFLFENLKLEFWLNYQGILKRAICWRENIGRQPNRANRQNGIPYETQEAIGAITGDGTEEKNHITLDNLFIYRMVQYIMQALYIHFYIRKKDYIIKLVILKIK